MNTLTIPLEQHLKETEFLRTEVETLCKKIKYLEEQLNWFQKQIFGKRSEKIVEESANQLTLFDAPEAPQVEKEKTIAEHTRKTIKKNNSNKISFPENLPIERSIIDLKDGEKICPQTGKPLIKIGEEISQKLAHKPGSYFIKEIIRPKYAAPKDGQEGIVIAPLPDSLLSRCKADESLLADILVKKFADHLPLYRQSEILSRQNPECRGKVNEGQKSDYLSKG